MKRETDIASKKGAPQPAASLAARAEALLRSLAGIANAMVELDSKGRIHAIHIVSMPGIAQKALVRNVQSGIMAVLGVNVDSKKVFVVEVLPAARVVNAPPTAAQKSVVQHAQVKAPAPSPKKMVMDLPAQGAHSALREPREPRTLPDIAPALAKAKTGYTPEPKLEQLEMTRYSGDQLQCRVVIEVEGRRCTGQAEAGEEREGAVTLAARATLDALRHAQPGTWSFEGAADVIIAGQRHVCVSVRKSANAPALSGAAPVKDSVENAVALAVLNAAGIHGAPAKEKKTTRTLAHTR